MLELSIVLSDDESEAHDLHDVEIVHRRVGVFSGVDGDALLFNSEPFKAPTMFNSSDVAIITKMDIADAVKFDVAVVRRNIERLHLGIQIFEAFAKSRPGMLAVLFLLQNRLSYSRRKGRALHAEANP